MLASASPRRREILATLGLAFRVEASEVDESVSSGEPADRYVERLATEKARAVAGKVRDAVVLGADTSVVVDGNILGKPTDDADARQMLAQLQGRAHDVITAIALADTGEIIARATVTTRVWFASLSNDAIARYVASGDGSGKAGAYAIQGLAAGAVTRIDGSYTNVVGLPASETVEMLTGAGVLEEWP